MWCAVPTDRQASSAASTDSQVEQAREVAFYAHIEGMNFHEVAIRDPFEAEREYQALAKKIIDLLGPPKGVSVVEF